ncbi:very short patch repair endonuclease [Ligilactobacillus acidipiscis]|uniref:very short patch repair endonuclease n=1 Tax=Ligilactobacillus acidipiscis TaxID=89059 RepID=UPI003864680C
MKHPKSYNSDKQTRKRMSKVHLKGGKAEFLLAHSLWSNGIRYRKNYKELPGSPDIAITKYKIAIFVDGEFWHGYDWENKKKRLKRNRKYWVSKIEENMARDRRNDKKLNDYGWTVLHFWEKQVLKNCDYCVELVLLHIRSLKQ